MERNEQSSSRRHRAVPSIDTNASGIAESVASLNTLVTGESLHLSRFPQPPTAVPTPTTTPTRSVFAMSTSGGEPRLASPARSTLSLAGSTNGRSTTLSPTRSIFSTRSPKRTRNPSSPKPSLISSILPEGAASPGPSRRAASPASESSSMAPLLLAEYVESFSPHRSNESMQPTTTPIVTPVPLPTSKPPQNFPSPRSNASVPLTATPQSIRSSRPLPPRPVDSKASTSYSWHDGSSAIIADPVEDRLLPTAFITGLLEATSGIGGDEIVQTPRPHEARRSALPLSPYTDAHASPNADANFCSSLLIQPTQSDEPPSTAGLDLRSDLRSSIASRSISGDSDTLYMPAERIDVPFIGTATMARAGPQGASVIGYAPANLRQLTTTRTSSIQATRASVPNSTFCDKHAVDPVLPNSQNFDIETEKLPYSRALSSPAIRAETIYRDFKPPQPRMSTHSMKTTRTNRSVRSFVSSFFSKDSNRNHAANTHLPKPKPLPPIPIIPQIPISVEVQNRMEEAELPLPTLAERGGTLLHLLEQGIHPHHSVDGTMLGNLWKQSDLKPLRNEEASGSYRSMGVQPKRKTLFDKVAIPVVMSLLVITAIIVGSVVGTTMRRRHCPNDMTGARCNLNATCICVWPPNAACTHVAQALVSLLPNLNTLFQTNHSIQTLSSAIWYANIDVGTGNCASQALLVDVAPLDATTHPNRTAWAQTALLWNLLTTLDVNTARQLQKSVQGVPWQTLSTDGPVANAGPSFQFQPVSSAYTLDFGAQTVTQPGVSFVADGNVDPAQNAEVNENMHVVLNRMFSYASASAHQQRSALLQYWRTKPDNPDMNAFMNAVSSADVLIPFDATSTSVNSLLSNSTTAPFPPPQACYPGYTQAQLQRLSTIEHSAFGLPPISPASDFSSACYPNRPVYGILDITRMRLPFPNSRHGAVKQAVALQGAARSRVVVASGELGLTSLTATENPADATLFEVDPRRFGTLTHMDHVIFNYLTSLPDPNVVSALIRHVLSSPPVPPTDDLVASLPLLEVAIFGSLTPQDIDHTVASFTTPGGDLFFGSDQASTLRNWSLRAVPHGSVVWTENATSPLVVRDNSIDDPAFRSVWDPASLFFSLHPPGVNVTVFNITNGFQAKNKFTP